MHPRLLEIISRDDNTYREQLKMLATYASDLKTVARTDVDPLAPTWPNPYFFGLDALALYGFIRDRRPKRYVEIGSGFSTRFAARAKRDGSTGTQITSIDPTPRTEVEALCDRRIKSPLELVDLSTFEELEPGDVILMDGSHRVFTGSDTTVFFLEVLPRLATGVLVGVHDIWLPLDYPPEWTSYHFSEHYLMGALLLGEPEWIRPVLACSHVTHDARLSMELEGVWSELGLTGLDRLGLAYWFEIARERDPQPS